MSCKKSLDEIREELSPLKKHWVVIYGSYVRKECTDRSDIDIAVITKIKDIKQNIRILNDILGKVPEYYDVKIFELLPLYLKMEIFREHIVVFGDPIEISEYMFQYYRIWRDMEYRVKENKFKNVDEILEGVLRRKAIKGI